MATITLTKQRQAKNGMVSFKTGKHRAAGTVYFDKKMFAGAVPEQIIIDADGIQEAIPEPVKAPKAAKEAPAAPVAEPASAQA